MNAFLFVAFLNLAIFADATHDPILQSLQNQIVSLEQMVQQLSTDLTDLKQQHTHLQNKYRAVSDELNKLRTCEAANQNQIHSLRSTTESVPEKPRRTLTKGQKGDKGDRGEQGLKGEAGTDGFNGDDGFDGPKGVKGDRGYNGSKGDIGSRGVPGPTGPKGDRGEKGESGLTVSEAMGTKVAFSVSDLDVLKLTDHSSLILVFDRIQSNFGNAYNKNNGIFTCTTSGTYVITWSIEVKENTAVRSYLEKNGQTMSLLSVTSPAISSSSSSQTSILHLTSGDRLYIEALPIASTSGVIVGSSFAAFLLY